MRHRPRSQRGKHRKGGKRHQLPSNLTLGETIVVSLLMAFVRAVEANTPPRPKQRTAPEARQLRAHGEIELPPVNGHAVTLHTKPAK